MPNIDIPIYDNLLQWQNKHYANDTEALKALDEGYNQDSIFEVYQQKKEEIGLTFDFMEGKDPKNENDYKTQLEKLAKGELSFHDIDEDGKISKSEYILKEVGNISNYKNDLEAFQAILYSYVMFEVLDCGMKDSVADNSISQSEFEHFYINLDQYQGLDEENKPVLTQSDGVLDIDASGSFCVDIPGYYSGDLINQALECYNNNDFDKNDSDSQDLKDAKTLAGFCNKTLGVIKKYS